MLLHAIASPWVWAGFVLYFIDFLLWMLILKESDLGRAFPLSSLTYLTTLIAAISLFHEAFDAVRILGVAIIIVGIAILSADEDSDSAPPSPTSPGSLHPQVDHHVKS